MQIIITRDNVFDTIVMLNATNATNAIDVRTIANALQTTTKITRRHLRTLRDTNRIVYANRVAFAIVANDDDTNDTINMRNNNDETRVRRDMTRVVANVNNVDTTRDNARVTTRTRATINMFANALNARRTRTNDDTTTHDVTLNDTNNTSNDDHDVYALIDANEIDIVDIDTFDNDDAIDAFLNTYA